VLAVAVDLHHANATELGWIARMTQTLAESVDDLDLVVVQSRGNAAGARPSRPEDVAQRFESMDVSAPGELSRLILDVADGFRDSTRLVGLFVVTDGLGERGKALWKQAHDAASELGVPILVGGIWSEGFGSGLRKDLRKLANGSGGGVFYVQGPEQVDDLVDRFRDLIVVDGTGGP
jgi:hypothetical protein